MCAASSTISAPKKVLKKVYAHRCNHDSWVMLDESKGFVPLPRERILFTSPPRTSMNLQSTNSYPGKAPLAIYSAGGTAHITNQRLIYLPATPTPHLQSFSCPLLNLHDTRADAPFFGANYWKGIVQPVTGGGIPPHLSYVEIKLTFKDGGAFDFDSSFKRVREELVQAREIAQMSGGGSGVGGGSRDGGVGGGTGGPAGVDYDRVHLDQLPAYEETGTSAAPVTNSSSDNNNNITIIPPLPSQQPASSATGEGLRRLTRPTPSTDGNGQRQDSFQPPSEPPPGYEEAQSSSVANSLEESLRRSSR